MRQRLVRVGAKDGRRTDDDEVAFPQDVGGRPEDVRQLLGLQLDAERGLA